MASGSTKNGFDFRMSKKVAELTQVVHMLFTRNHEKEVDVEALKDAYEYEIELVINDAKGRISDLENKIKILESSIPKDDDVQSAISAALAEREGEWTVKVSALTEELAQEKQDCQHARDLLISANHDIEQLHQAHSKDLLRYQNEINTSNAEIRKLRADVERLQGVVRGYEGQLSDNHRSKDGLSKEMDGLQRSLEEMGRVKEQILQRNKQLENDIKHLKRELSKRIANSAKQKETPPPPMPISSDYEAELEMLRIQVQKYKNELTNREMNFNRMFTEKQPINVGAGKKGVKLQLTQAPGDGMNNLRLSREYTTIGASRQRTFYSPTSKSSEVIDVPDSPRSSKSFDRLPQLDQSQRARLQKLAKPKPLSRELLSAKAKS